LTRTSVPAVVLSHPPAGATPGRPPMPTSELCPYRSGLAPRALEPTVTSAIANQDTKRALMEGTPPLHRVPSRARLVSDWRRFSIELASGTGAAWMAELDETPDRGHAALMVTTANFAGLAVGPLVSGFLAQYAPWPLRLSYAIQFAALLLFCLVVPATPETVA